MRVAMSFRRVTVIVDEEILRWPGHRFEIVEKVEELEALLDSLEEGKIENWK